LQGEHDDVNFNDSVGEFMLEGLNEEADEGNEILVRFDLNLDGILTVSAVERDTGLEKRLTLENAITRFRVASHDDAKARLAEVFGDSAPGGEAQTPDAAATVTRDADSPVGRSDELVAKARRLITQAAPEDADEIRELIDGIQKAESSGDGEGLRDLAERLEDMFFYLEDA
jgi:molecular chaperone DnaK